MKNQERNLRKAIKLNAAFSLISGVSLIIFSNQVAEIMHVGNSQILLFIGLGLIVFVVSLLYTAFSSTLNQKQVKIIIYQDWAWVATSAVILVFDPFNISAAGNIMITIVALIVTVLAMIQARNLRRMVKMT